jgi:hypothetical protein
MAFEFRQVKGRWSLEHQYCWRLDPTYFPVYDSFNQTREDGKSGKGELKQWERRSIPGVFAWFFLRHPVRITIMVAFLAFCLYLMSGGGGRLMNYGFRFFAGGFLPPPRHVTPASVKVVTPSVIQALPGVTTFSASTLPTTQPTTQPYQPSAETLAKIADLESKLAKAHEQQLEAWSISLLTEHAVTFREGYTYQVGAVIDYGPFKDHKIEGIDYERRIVHLSGDIILRMGRAWRVQSATDTSHAPGERDPSGVPRPVQPPQIGPPPGTGPHSAAIPGHAFR